MLADNCSCGNNRISSGISVAVLAFALGMTVLGCKCDDVPKKKDDIEMTRAVAQSIETVEFQDKDVEPYFSDSVQLQAYARWYEGHEYAVREFYRDGSNL